MRCIRAVRLFRWLAITLLPWSAIARAELAAWDQAKAAALTKDLAATTKALYETFIDQPRPSLESMQIRPYYRLKQEVWLLGIEASELATMLEKGDGREQTILIYDNMMQLVRRAREDAEQAFIAHDVEERATAVRAVLNQLGPYYDSDFQTLPPPHGSEPPKAR